MDTGYASIHHSKYWMPIHYDTIEDGQNKKSHLLFSYSDMTPFSFPAANPFFPKLQNHRSLWGIYTQCLDLGWLFFSYKVTKIEFHTTRGLQLSSWKVVHTWIPGGGVLSGKVGTGMCGPDRVLFFGLSGLPMAPFFIWKLV